MSKDPMFCLSLIDLESSYKCKKGCPRCIHLPKLKDAENIDKKEGLLLAKEIIEMSKEKAAQQYDTTSHGWEKIQSYMNNYFSGK